MSDNFIPKTKEEIEREEFQRKLRIIFYNTLGAIGILFIGTVLIALLYLWYENVKKITYTCQTDYCHQVQYQAQLEKEKIAQEQIKLEQEYQLELLRIRALQEASKRTELRVQEAANEEMSLWEWVAIWAAVYTGYKAFEYLLS